MALSTLYNVPNSLNDLNVFSFTNMNEHEKIAAALLSQYSVAVPLYPLDPIPFFDMGAWLEQHQILHNIMNATLGTNSDDLTTVNFNDKNQLAEWIWLHAQEHYQAAGKLGLQ